MSRIDDIIQPLLDSWASLADAYAEEMVLDSISKDIPIYWSDAKSELLQAVLEVIDKQTFQMLLQLHNQEHLNGGYIQAVDLIDEIKELFGVEE